MPELVSEPAPVSNELYRLPPGLEPNFPLSGSPAAASSSSSGNSGSAASASNAGESKSDRKPRVFYERDKDGKPLNAEEAVRQKFEVDSYYFDSYSTRRIHELMLRSVGRCRCAVILTTLLACSDTVRTLAYRDFMYNNRYLLEGKVSSS